jgi:hypothetical protein
MAGRLGFDVKAEPRWEALDFALGGLASSQALSKALSHGFGSCFPRGISGSCSLRAISGSGSGPETSFAKGDFAAGLDQGLSQVGKDELLGGTALLFETAKKLEVDTDLLW